MKVKYLHKSYSKANQKKVLTSFLFYIQLKNLNLPQHEIECGTSIKLIQSELGYSAGSVSSQLNLLVKNGFAVRYYHLDGKAWKYVLVSILKAYNKLGFRFKDNKIEQYRYTTIDSRGMSKSDLKTHLNHIELQFNIRNQNFKSDTLLNNKIEYHEKTLKTTKSEKVKERKKATILNLKSEKDRKIAECSYGSNRISYRTVAKNLGYKSHNTAVNLIKNGENTKLFSIKKSTTLIASNVSKIHFNIGYAGFDASHWMFGKVYKKECNVYTFNAINTDIFKSTEITVPLNNH